MPVGDEIPKGPLTQDGSPKMNRRKREAAPTRRYGEGSTDLLNLLEAARGIRPDYTRRHLVEDMQAVGCQVSYSTVCEAMRTGRASARIVDGATRAVALLRATGLRAVEEKYPRPEIPRAILEELPRRR